MNQRLRRFVPAMLALAASLACAQLAAPATPPISPAATDGPPPVERTSDEPYVVTGSILKRYTAILERYAETPNQPHEGIGIWVSGFYGSGKSSFAKLLGYAIQNHPVAGIPAGKRFAERAGDNKLSVLLAKISEQIPTHAVIFDVATDRGIRSGNQTLTEITYRLFLESLGYAKDLDVSELEIELEKDGRLEAFEVEFKRIYGREWSTSKTRTAFALSEASRTMHELDPKS